MSSMKELRREITRALRGTDDARGDEAVFCSRDEVLAAFPHLESREGVRAAIGDPDCPAEISGLYDEALDRHCARLGIPKFER